MAEKVKTAIDREFEDHIEALKGVPDMAKDCEAANPMSSALILFGRVLYDQKEIIEGLPDAIMKKLEEAKKPDDTQPPPAVANKNGLIGYFVGLGVPAPICALLFFVGKGKGWW